MNFPFNNRGFWFIPAAAAAISAVAKKTKSSNIISNFGNSVASGVGSAVGGALGGKLTDKITGIPSALSASEQGQQAMDYMNAAYPGTTAWDRLGAGGAGAPSSTSAVNTEKMKMRQENKMQSRALTTQAMIADRQNRTHLISTAAGYGIDGIKQVLNAYDGFRQTPFETQVSLAGKKLPAEIHSLASQGNLAQSQVGGHDRRSRRADEIIDAEQHQRYFGSASSSGATASKMFSDQFNRSNNALFGFFRNEGNKFKNAFKNTKLPFRFNFSPIR